MTNRFNYWRPDTCRCGVGYTWDDTLPEASRTHVYGIPNPIGPEHLTVPPPLVVTIILDEQNRKNGTQRLAESIQSGVTFDGFGWDWSGSGSERILTVHIPGLRSNQINQLQSLINTQFGSGRVLVTT